MNWYWWILTLVDFKMNSQARAFLQPTHVSNHQYQFNNPILISKGPYWYYQGINIDTQDLIHWTCSESTDNVFFYTACSIGVISITCHAKYNMITQHAVDLCIVMIFTHTANFHSIETKVFCLFQHTCNFTHRKLVRREGDFWQFRVVLKLATITENHNLLGYLYILLYIK